MKIKHGEVYFEDQGFIKTDLMIEKNYFSEQTSDPILLDATDCYVIPGLIDVHFHGCVGYDFCDGTQEALENIATYQIQNGITSICPASMTLPEKTLVSILKNAQSFASLSKDSISRLCGIHLEGPIIASEKKGAQNGDFIKDPNLALFYRLRDCAPELIKLITLAPELPGSMDFIEEISSLAHVSLGHTSCDYNTAAKAFQLGADHITHLYNAMPGFTHRSPGPIGAAFDNPCVMVELICDGVHIHPSVVRATFQLFGDDRMVLISDSMMATGMNDGDYSLGGQKVSVDGNKATLLDGTLAGSVTNLMNCMRTAISMGIPLESAIKSATINPAKSIGIDTLYGSIKKGKVADCLILDKQTLALKTVILGGKIAYES